MSRRTDLQDRLRELSSVSHEHRVAEAAAQKLIANDDLDGATAALDDLELALHPALAAGGAPGGSGLPDQWTDGGNGDVTATTDDATKVPFTVDMPAGSQDEGTSAFIVNADPNVDNGGSPFVDMGNFDLNISGPADNDPALQLFESDGNGQVSISPGQGMSARPAEANATAMYLKFANGTTPDVLFGNLLVALGMSSGGILADVRVNGEGFLILAKHAAPSDAMLQTGDLALWFDQTNGAAKLMIKAKQADGAVKTGQVALS